jgi:hypothetical protein
MNIPNDYDLDLQKIAILLKGNKIDYKLKEDEIIVTSNSIENRIFCDIRTISLVATTPKLFAPLLVIGVFIITGLLAGLLLKNVEKPVNEWIISIPAGLAGGIWFLAEPIYLRFKPKILAERKKIKEILLNYKEQNDI